MPKSIETTLADPFVYIPEVRSLGLPVKFLAPFVVDQIQRRPNPVTRAPLRCHHFWHQPPPPLRRQSLGNLVSLERSGRHMQQFEG